jgi:dipeptidyl aminopeptidase/acylaminoacyl peptidase
VVLFGYSRGAIVAAMVATLDPRLAAVVLGAGAYDFFTWRPTLPGISRNLSAEAGTSAEAFMARSAIYHVQQIRAPILLLHGTADERIPVQQAEAFAEKLKAAGVRFRFKEFPGARMGFRLRTSIAKSIRFLTNSSAEIDVRSIAVGEMAAFGAPRPLPRVPTKVG